MALRGCKPKEIQKRLKALFYGSAGVGKTTASIQFPKPYLIDTERGAENNQYVKILEKQGGAIFQSCEFDDLITEVKSLLTEKHDYRTLIIDPLTILYNNLVDKCASDLKRKSADKNSDGTEFGRHYSEAGKYMKHLLNLLLRLDMNVIITSHSKNEYGQGMSVLGQTFDCYKKLDYLFDLVFEIQKRGKERVGIVKKTRIESFGDGETFPFSYAEIAKRYGKDILEKESSIETLASDEQVKEIHRLIELLKIPEDKYQKWLDKTSSNSFDEMKSEDSQKIIEHLNSQIKGA